MSHRITQTTFVNKLVEEIDKNAADLYMKFIMAEEGVTEMVRFEIDGAYVTIQILKRLDLP